MLSTNLHRCSLNENQKQSEALSFSFVRVVFIPSEEKWCEKPVNEYLHGERDWAKFFEKKRFLESTDKVSNIYQEKRHSCYFHLNLCF